MKDVTTILVDALDYLMNLISPEIKTELKTVLDSLEAKAAATPNPWDDRLVKFLRMLLNM